MRPQQRWIFPLFSILALALTSCLNSLDPEVAPGPPRTYSVTLASGLLQRVELRPGAPRVGDVIAITSVLLNVTPDTISVFARQCGLEFDTELEMARPGVWCEARAFQADLGTGDSVMTYDERIMYAPPGVYPLRIIHALDPPGSLLVMLEIAPRWDPF